MVSLLWHYLFICLCLCWVRKKINTSQLNHAIMQGYFWNKFCSVLDWKKLSQIFKSYSESISLHPVTFLFIRPKSCIISIYFELICKIIIPVKFDQNLTCGNIWNYHRALMALSWAETRLEILSMTVSSQIWV
jgi:hypothetical protein